MALIWAQRRLTQGVKDRWCTCGTHNRTPAGQAAITPLTLALTRSRK